MTVPGSYWEDSKKDEPVRAPAGVSAPASGEDVGWVEDTIKGIGGGLGRGITGLIGLPGTAQDLVRGGIDYLLPPSQKQLEARQQAPNLLPSAHTVQSAAEKVTGPFYEPKTVPGQYASTAAEVAPGALLGGGGAAAKVANTLIPAALSETAGQVTKGTPVEPWARGIAGVAGGVGAAKAITPAAAAPRAYQQAVGTLEREGIPLTAGQKTGSRPIQWAESVAADMPGSGTAARNLYGKGKDAYDRSITEGTFDRGQLTARGVPPDVNLPDAQVAKAGRQSLSDEYARIHQSDLVANPQLLNRMQGAQSEYERLVLPSERASKVADTYNDIIDKLVAGKGRMAGDEYQSIRSQLSAASKTATNPKEASALGEMKQALDGAFAAGVPPRDAAALALNNQRWGNMRTIEDAVASSNTGNLSPARVAQAVRAGRGGQYGAQTGNLDELTRAAAMVMKDLPNSGTGPRTQMQQLMNFPAMLSAGGGGTIGGMVGGIPGALIGAGLPLAASRFVVSKGGQKYLGSRALPQNTRDVLAQTLLQQASSQPSIVDRNERERKAYEEKRKNR